MSIKMNPEIKAKWVQALRSGEYKQGVGRLRSLGDEFCCLGVLTDLAVKEGVEGVEWDDDMDGIAVLEVCKGWSGDTFPCTVTANLPFVVMEWADLSSPDPEVYVPASAAAESDGLEGIRALSVLNDAGGSFATIADVIEESL